MNMGNNFGGNYFLELASCKGAIMPYTGMKQTSFLRRSKAGEKVIGCEYLWRRCDIVLAPSNKQCRRTANGARINELAANDKLAFGQVRFLEHALDRFHVKFCGHIHDGVVLIIECTVRFRRCFITLNEVLVKFPTLVRMALPIHHHEVHQLQMSGVNPSARSFEAASIRNDRCQVFEK